MKEIKNILAIVILLLPLATNAQKKPSKFQLEFNYGLNGSFLVRNYSEYSSLPGKRFYKKNFIGTIAGIEGRLNVGKNGSLGLGFSKSINKRVINYFNGRNVGLMDFTISHTNYYNVFDYEYKLLNKKKNNIAFQLGIYYLRSKMQEIDISPDGVMLDERNFKNSKVEDGGALIGVHYFKKIDTKFDLGIKTRASISLAMGIMDAITLTPTLRYNF